MAIVTQTRALVGGVETYLQRVIAGLVHRHAVAFWSASDEASPRGSIAMPASVTTWPKGASVTDAVRSLRAFAPDVLFSHGLDDPSLEAQVLTIAPTVAVQHNYHGACVSGTKTMSWPTVRACERRLGPACLALYFPRRCGGLSPFTMARMYETQTARLATLGRCAHVVTLSAHMRDEMVRQGLPAHRVHVVPPFVEPREILEAAAIPGDDTIRLLFLGRLEPLKGVSGLIDTLPLVAASAGRQVVLTVAGEGAERGKLEVKARRAQAADPRVSVRFAGWQDAAGRDRLLAECHALVVPSLWPEPFGLVGLEAAAAGVPAVAFATGGIVDWLKDGTTGCLAPTEGARRPALAGAILRCVVDPGVQRRLAEGAREFAARWTIDRHLTMLDSVFALAAHSAGGSDHP